MPRDPHRHRRIESELQRVISELLRREVKDPRVGKVTLTAVSVSPDLGHAQIYYALFGQGHDPKNIQAGLDGAARFMRGHVARALKLRVAPELHFRLDEQLVEGVRLNELIDSAVATDAQRHVDDDASPDRDSLPTNEPGKT